MTAGASVNSVIVLNFGAQYGKLIARRVRESGVYCEVYPHDIAWEELVEKDPQGIILTGGPSSVYDDEAPRCDERIFSSGMPVLGICYGLQLMAYQMQGKVEPAQNREYGRAELHVKRHDPLFEGLPSKFQVWMSHGDLVERLPAGFQVLASTSNTPVAAIGDSDRNLYGVQFHPESILTGEGKKLLSNFVRKT